MTIWSRECEDRGMRFDMVGCLPNLSSGTIGCCKRDLGFNSRSCSRPRILLGIFLMTPDDPLISEESHKQNRRMRGTYQEGLRFSMALSDWGEGTALSTGREGEGTSAAHRNFRIS
jgi:hypothetical protein